MQKPRAHGLAFSSSVLSFTQRVACALATDSQNQNLAGASHSNAGSQQQGRPVPPNHLRAVLARGGPVARCLSWPVMGPH